MEKALLQVLADVATCAIGTHGLVVTSVVYATKQRLCVVSVE